MDPVLAEIYSTVMPAAPYVIGAYALIWVILLAYLAVTLSKLSKVKKDVQALDEGIDSLRKKVDQLQ